MRRLVAVVMTLLAGAAVAQTIYQGRDARGNPVFTDQPRAGDTPVELPPVNTTPATPAPPPARPRREAFAGYDQIAISAPGSVPNHQIPVDVAITIEPELREGHFWRLSLDGDVVASGRDAGFSFPALDRGLHTLELEVVDAGGGVLGAAAPANVFVQFPKGKH